MTVTVTDLFCGAGSALGAADTYEEYLMTVYVDTMRLSARVGRYRARWSHVFTDGDHDELHAVAARIPDPPARVRPVEVVAVLRGDAASAEENGARR